MAFELKYSDQKPEAYRFILITQPGSKEVKLFAGWYDMWRLNSGITSFEFDGDEFAVYGYSGSRYICNKNSMGTLSSCAYGIFQSIMGKELPDDVKIKEISLEEAIKIVEENR